MSLRVARLGGVAARQVVSRRLAHSHASSGNASEMAHFAELAESWWDPNGPQRILHKMNIMRLDFIHEVLARGTKPGYSLRYIPESKRAQFEAHPTNLDVMDVGCGGGLLSESLSRWRSVKSVTGIDVTPEVIAAAQLHAKHDPALAQKLKYKVSTIEETSPEQQYDVVTMFEVVEHLDNPAEVLQIAMNRVKVGGHLFLSTINRTTLSWLTTIVAGEQLLKIVPPGTHTWSKYINDFELKEWLESQPGWSVVKTQGCMYIPPPFAGEWVRFDQSSESVGAQMLNCTIGTSGGNYLMAAQRVK